MSSSVEVALAISASIEFDRCLRIIISGQGNTQCVVADRVRHAMV